jgi:hypothetical protein
LYRPNRKTSGITPDQRGRVYPRILLPERTNLFAETRPIGPKTRHHYIAFGASKDVSCAGKQVEHWDVLEAIPPSSEWKNANGKF